MVLVDVRRDDGIAVLTFDLPGKKVNTLGRAVLTELGGIAHALATRTDLRGLLFRSGKPGQSSGIRMRRRSG